MLPPEMKAQPFPAAAFTPTPARLKMGVEAQASAARPPVNPALNTTASDRMAALGRNPSIKPLAAAAPKIDLFATPAPLRQGSKSPLGGMDTRSISERGGPMRYSRQGEGTTNPNAYKVGGNSKPTGLRLLERAARQRDPEAIRQLAMIESRTQSPGGDWEDRTFGRPLTRPQPSTPQGPDIFATEAAATPTDPNADFWASQDQQTADFMAAQSQEAPPDTSPVDIYAMEGAGGFVPMLRTADGKSKAAGGFFPGAAPDPMALPALPATPDQIAAKAREEEQFFTSQGLTLQPPEKASDSAGRTYARQQEPDQIAVNEAGKTMKIPAGYDAPEGFTFLKPKTAQPTGPQQAAAKGQTASGNTFKRKA